MKNLASLGISLLTSFLYACSSVPAGPPRPLVLIQGLHLESGVWDTVRQMLPFEAFTFIDLGRFGRDGKGPASIQAIAKKSCTIIPEGSILVAHSIGGAIANEIFGICPGKVARIIYVAALVPLNGEKPLERMTPADQAAYGKAVDFKKPKIVPKSPRVFFSAVDPLIPETFSLPPIHEEWMSMGAEPVHFDSSKYALLPKFYIYTAKDPVVNMITQRKYAETAKIENTDVVFTGHLPMLSDPKSIAGLITQWSNLMVR